MATQILEKPIQVLNTLLYTIITFNHQFNGQGRSKEGQGSSGRPVATGAVEKGFDSWGIRPGLKDPTVDPLTHLEFEKKVFNYLIALKAKHN